MKFLALLILTITSLTTFAKSYDCFLTVGTAKAQGLIQTSFAEDDPEEESEEYELSLASGIKAYVLYLPYQDGLDLYLEKDGLSTSANFDQEGDEFAYLRLKIEDVNYRLYCSKND